jgi:hypothetical protein
MAVYSISPKNIEELEYFASELSVKLNSVGFILNTWWV